VIHIMREKKTFMLYYDWFGNLEFIYKERDREIESSSIDIDS